MTEWEYLLEEFKIKMHLYEVLLQYTIWPLVIGGITIYFLIVFKDSVREFIDGITEGEFFGNKFKKHTAMTTKAVSDAYKELEIINKSQATKIEELNILVNELMVKAQIAGIKISDYESSLAEKNKEINELQKKKDIVESNLNIRLLFQEFLNLSSSDKALLCALAKKVGNGIAEYENYDDIKSTFVAYSAALLKRLNKLGIVDENNIITKNGFEKLKIAQGTLHYVVSNNLY